MKDFSEPSIGSASLAALKHPCAAAATSGLKSPAAQPDTDAAVYLIKSPRPHLEERRSANAGGDTLNGSKNVAAAVTATDKCLRLTVVDENGPGLAAAMATAASVGHRGAEPALVVEEKNSGAPAAVADDEEDSDSLGSLIKRNSEETNGGGVGHMDRLGVPGLCMESSTRSSSSSLAKSESSDTLPGCAGGVLKSTTTPSRSSSAQQKKVSIQEESGPVVRRDRTVSPCNGERLSQHRASLIQVSSEKRAKKVKFFINGDKFFKGAVIAVNNEKFRTFEKLLEHLTRIMCTQVTLPNGVRYIFSLEGRLLQDVDALLNGESYVCSSLSMFKKLDYNALTDEDHTWNRVKRETYYLGMRNGSVRRDLYRLGGHSKSFGQTKSSSSGEEERINIKPRIITVLRSGTRPRKAVRVLLNNRNTKSLDMVLADLTNTVKLDTGAVRKMYTLCGNPVNSLHDLGDEEVFIAYGVDKCSPDDFDLDLIEFRNVQAILKSQKLDLKYEKFAHMSPKTSRKKFLLSRFTRGKRAASKSRAGGGGGGVDSAGVLKSGNSFNTIDDLSESYPSEVTNKYHMRQIVGDGNFAVVRLCYHRQTRREFAAKIIDKSKCQGKEHMIESEIAILSSVSHPNIIQLEEVFDFPAEKYLIMEYVQGGDLFDAIASDIKYTEAVARDMVTDLANALQYLHDRMVCHRDIKPENLLVIDRLHTKSLKLADFGLAVTVREPLFTVCGTPTYVAPEILAETGYGVKVDIWAIGVILYILLCGYPPFSSRTNNQEELFDQILSGLFEFNSPDWDEVSYPAKELISWSLVVDPLQRYSAKEILNHPWIVAPPSS